LGLLLVGCLAALSAPARADDAGPPALKVTIEFPGSPGQIVLHPTNHFRVIIENVSPSSLLLANNEDAGLSLEVTESDGSKEILQAARMEANAKYVIGLDRVDPGKTQVRDIDPAHWYSQISPTDSGQWHPKLFTTTGVDRTVTMRAVFEMRRMPFDITKTQYYEQKWPDRPPCWAGKVVSPDYTVVLGGR